MYGIVNKAIQGLVIENFGEETWEKIKIQTGMQVPQFISNNSYDDAYTYKLAQAASEVLNISLDDVLLTFGEYWILKTGKEHYGSLMQAGGRNLKEFLVNLPNFHSRVMLYYPNITPPEFKVDMLPNSRMAVHYFSERPGLEVFVRGLLLGLGKMFGEKIDVIMKENRAEGHDHEIFEISWV